MTATPPPRPLRTQEGDDRFKLASEVRFGKAADFSRGLFKQVSTVGLLQAMSNLLVLNVSRTPLRSAELETICTAAPGLIRIDASRCSLDELPHRSVFESLQNVKVALFHQNMIRRWQDVLSLCGCPALIWLTIFQNPVAGDPTIRSVVLAEKPSILAVDHRMVTEPERLGPEWDVVWSVLSRSTRFGARLLDPDSLDLEVNGSRKSLAFEQKDDFMIHLALQEIRVMEGHYQNASPARCIQAVWRGFHVRRSVEQHKVRMVQAVKALQRGARRLLWRKDMAEYVKEYLGEIDELDLLLDAKEMLRRRALKLIEARVRRWILQRSLQRRERKAAELICRHARSCLVRRRLLYARADLYQCQTFYFPERHAWEFHVLCNLVLRAHGWPSLPADHTFQDANVLGIRFPEFNEAPRRDNTLLRFLGFAQRVVLRPLRSGRFPAAWDGPFHRLVGKNENELQRNDTKEGKEWAERKVRRRGDSFNNRCRRAFRNSCCPGPHPVRRIEAAAQVQECVLLKEFLEGPEQRWPAEAQADGFFRAFLQEARGLRTKTWHPCWVQATGKVDPTGLRNYSQTAWLSQRVLMMQMPTAKVALEMCYALHAFSKLAKLLPSVEPVPALYGKAVAEIAAATVIQSCWRAHKERLSLGSLADAILHRRAAICIQRSWRWNLLKRRLELLQGALRLTRSIRSSVVYMEERLFLGLNLIAAVERYPRAIPESRLAFGFAESEAPVLLAAPRVPGENDRAVQAQAQLPEFHCESPLRPVRGLQGLLLEGISEERTIEVPSPFLETFARTCAAGGMEKELAEVGIKKEALAASAGALRFVELRFPTVLQARQRALILYFCTFNFETHMAVPLLVRHQLYDADTTYGVLQLWDLYGLDWPRASKAGIFLLRALDVKPSEAVAVNGSKQRKAAEFRADWQSTEEDQRRAGLAQLHAERELQRLERLNKKKRNADVEEIMQQLSIVPQQELLDALQSGKLPSGVDSQLVEAWILGNRLNFSGRAIDKKQLAKHAATEKLAIRRLLAAREEQNTRRLGSRGADSTQPREWEARLMDFYSRANAARVAEEAQCLAARRSQGDDRQISAQRPSLPLPSELASARSEAEPPEPPEPGFSAEQAAEELPVPPPSGPSDSGYAQQKASKAARQEMRQMAATFSTRRCFLQRTQKTADVRAVKAEKEEQTKVRLDDCKRVWATRTRVLAAKHGTMLEYRRREVDLREHQLKADLREVRDRRCEELESKRAAVLEQKGRFLEGPQGLHAAIASPRTRAADTVRVGMMEAVELMATHGKLATATFSSGTESTRASAMGSTFQDLRSLADVTWTDSASSGAVASRMASTMLSVQARKRHLDDERQPMAVTDGWQSDRAAVRPPPWPRPEPGPPRRPLRLASLSSWRAPSDRFH